VIVIILGSYKAVPVVVFPCAFLDPCECPSSNRGMYTSKWQKAPHPQAGSSPVLHQQVRVRGVDFARGLCVAPDVQLHSLVQERVVAALSELHAQVHQAGPVDGLPAPQEEFHVLLVDCPGREGEGRMGEREGRREGGREGGRDRAGRGEEEEEDSM